MVKELDTSKLVTITTEENLYDALEKISLQDFSMLPVVAPDDPAKLMGILTRRDIMGAYTKAVVKKSLLTRPERAHDL